MSSIIILSTAFAIIILVTLVSTYIYDRFISPGETEANHDTH